MHHRMYLRSLTGTLALFRSHPVNRQNASQLSVETFFSELRPMALRKSCGVAILPLGLGIGRGAAAVE